MTSIEWTTETWNPVTGCTKISAGCKHCYAERVAERFWKDRSFTEVRCHPERLDAPLRWRKPRRVFVNSMSDLFHGAIPDEFIDDVFGVMAKAWWNTYQVLTKRPGRMLDYLRGHAAGGRHIWTAAQRYPWPAWAMRTVNRGEAPGGWPLPNVWLGVSVEDQATADERIPLLLQTPAAVRFVSYEPALGPVKFWGPESPTWNHPSDNGLDWVIVGGESGPGARPCDLDWIRSIVAECREAGVPCFVKQDCGPRPGMQGRIPDDLWAMKEFPRA